MNDCMKMSRQKTVFLLSAVTLSIGISLHFLAVEPEVALIFGEPWEDMRKRSSASIGPAIPGHHWFGMPRSDARLHFIDPEYAFTTPPARFLTVSFDSDQHVSGVRMSPQVEPLLLDDTLKVVLDLQAQWRMSGWVPVRAKYDPPIEDTPEWRTKLQDIYQGGTSYWQAGNKYQVMLVTHRFRDERHPDEERYLITLSLGKPWVRP
ncbi:hypothetical protein PSH81_17730 [Pseudomonas sp. FP2335]|jgi:hypothetical protein|uniref:hypothetical protein n=1 Tax=Pseudomonas sp. FP2335 TaxID=2954092 RepID=UPI002732519F|nr:hypothetical protein [Pseudomonas sp. FP2335]WLH77579.1 hypothetical protein PSH81_17730 [Pseudomonas sp. FP2335]